MRIYLDNCSYNRPYDDQTQMRIYLETEAKLHIQDMTKNNELELVTSYMFDNENAKNRFLHKRKAISEFMNANESYYVSADRNKEAMSAGRIYQKIGGGRVTDNTMDIMDKGFTCLMERLGVINTERFIAMIKRESFNYTVWRRGYFDNLSLDETKREAAAYAEKHPHQGKGIRT